MALHGLLAQQCGHDMGLQRETLAPLSPPDRVQRLQQAMREAGLLGAGPAAAQCAQLTRLLAVFEANLNTGYVPDRPLDVPTRLLRAADVRPDDQGRATDRVQGWRLYAPLASDTVLTGNHMTMLQAPQVQALAQALLAPLSAMTAHQEAT
jgi:thioesterase domain-containing protein